MEQPDAEAVPIELEEKSSMEAEDLPSDPELPAAGAVAVVLTSFEILHQFGVWLERTHKEVRRLLHFCVDVERLRVLDENLQASHGDLEREAATTEDLEYLCSNYLSPGGGPRSLHKIPVEVRTELGELPNTSVEGGEVVTLKALFELQNRARHLFEVKFLPKFIEEKGSALSKTDRETLLSEQQKFRNEAQESHTPVEVVQKGARRKLYHKLGIHGGKPSWAEQDGEAAADAEVPAEEEPAEEEAAVAEETEEEAPKKPKPPLSDFTVRKVLGKGAFATVYKVTQNSTDDVYAMKVMDIKDLKMKGALNRVIDREKPVLEQISHPFIIGLMGAYVSKNRVYLVMEYCSGGDLKSVMNLHTRLGHFPESQARFYCAELILALECLHERGVIYRDLKPENVLLDGEGHIRLTDFGLVKQGVSGELAGAESFLGTPLYLSPEMVQKAGHGSATDWWGLGIMLFEMLTGDAPFQGDGTIDGLFTDIQQEEVPLRRGLHPFAMEAIRGLLQKDPAQRWKGSTLKSCRWFEEHNPSLHTEEDWEKLCDKGLTPPFVPAVDPEEAEMSEEGAEEEKPKEKKNSNKNNGPCSVM